MRTFHLGTILSVTTGTVVGPGGFSDVHDLIEYMAGEPVWTHQLPRVGRECVAPLRDQFPQLADVVVPQLASPEDYLDWLETQTRRYGTWFEVKPLAAGDHTSIDPLSEMSMHHPHVPVIPVVADFSSDPTSQEG